MNTYTAAPAVTFIAEHTVKSVPTYGVAIAQYRKSGAYRVGYYVRRGTFAHKVITVGPVARTPERARELANMLYAEIVREGSAWIHSLSGVRA